MTNDEERFGGRASLRCRSKPTTSSFVIRDSSFPLGGPASLRSLSHPTWLLACAVLFALSKPALAQSPPRLANRPQAAPAKPSRWVDQRVTGPFVTRAEFALQPYEPTLAELGQLQSDLARYVGVPASRQWIEIYLFAEKDGYADYLKRHLPGVPYRPALFVKSDGVCRVFAFRDDKLAVNLRHECTHALLHAVHPMVPLWLDEGLAEYFELPPPQRAFDNPYSKPLRWNARFRSVPRLEKLEGLGGMGDMGAAEYRYAWAWVHFMLHGSKPAHAELVGYLAAIRAQTPPGQLSTRLAGAVSSPYERLLTHLKKWKR
jgi:hypothetical protein